MPEARRDEIQPGELVKDGRYDATLYRLPVLVANIDYEVEHGLQNTPVKVQIVDSSEQIKYPKIVSKDETRVVLRFDAISLVTIRFE